MRFRNHAFLPHFSRGPRRPRYLKPGLKWPDYSAAMYEPLWAAERFIRGEPEGRVQRQPP